MENKFKVGDYVKANAEGNSRYSITNYDMKKGKVISIDGSEITIEIVEHKEKSQIGAKFGVDSKCFDLYFTLSDLQFADILILQNGERYVVADGYMMGQKSDYYCDADEIKDFYNDDLTRKYNNCEYDIVKVERVEQVIYEREEKVVEMTIAEISEKLGYEVKVVKEK